MAVEFRPEQIKITTGTTDNDTVTTKGYVDDVAVSINAQQEVLTVSTPGQTAFTLSQTPSGASAFGLFLNGQLRNNPTDYTFTGTSLTWNDPGGLTLVTADELIAWYDYTAPAGLPVNFEANALLQSNVTGDDTIYTIIFGTEIKDVGNNYDHTTGIFTAPLTGTYHFDNATAFDSLIGGHTNIDLYFQGTSESVRIFEGDPSSIITANRLILNGSLTTNLTAGNTMKILCKVGPSGQPKQVDILATFTTKFSGYYVGP